MNLMLSGFCKNLMPIYRPSVVNPNNSFRFSNFFIYFFVKILKKLTRYIGFSFVNSWVPRSKKIV